MPHSQSGRPVGSGTRAPHHQSESSYPRTYPPHPLLSKCYVSAALCSGGPHVLYESLAWQEEDLTPGRPAWPTPAKGREEKEEREEEEKRGKGSSFSPSHTNVPPPPSHHHTQAPLLLLTITHKHPSSSSPSHTSIPPPPPHHHTQAPLLLLTITHKHLSSSSPSQTDTPPPSPHHTCSVVVLVRCSCTSCTNWRPTISFSSSLSNTVHRRDCSVSFLCVCVCVCVER